MSGLDPQRWSGGRSAERPPGRSRPAGTGLRRSGASDFRLLHLIATVIDACGRQPDRGPGHPPAETVRVVATLRRFLRPARRVSAPRAAPKPARRRAPDRRGRVPRGRARAFRSKAWTLLLPDAVGRSLRLSGLRRAAPIKADEAVERPMARDRGRSRYPRQHRAAPGAGSRIRGRWPARAPRRLKADRGGDEFENRPLRKAARSPDAVTGTASASDRAALSVTRRTSNHAVLSARPCHTPGQPARRVACRVPGRRYDALQ